MNNGLSVIKNIIWSIAIVASLFALLIGLVFAISNKFDGEREPATMNIKTERSSLSSDKSSSESNTDIIGLPSENSNELLATQDMGLEYVFNLTFLCDSTIKGINEYSASLGSATPIPVWTTDGSPFPAASAESVSIVSPSDGSMLTPANAAMAYQPKRLIIYIGGDNLSSTNQDSFISGYIALINSIRNSSPNTSTIICCSLTSVSASYAGGDGLTPELIASANKWIQTVCTNTGASYADIASLLNDANGYLPAEYAAADGRSLNAVGISKLIEYFRMHGV